jgi:8-oxo-dGTP diphosphatase
VWICPPAAKRRHGGSRYCERGYSAVYDCKVYPLGELKSYRFVVILSRYEGKYLFSRHKERSTWETQGGYIEPGETPMEAARRELFEESGAKAYRIAPLCDYWAKNPQEESTGMVFWAEIETLGEMPESEMAEVKTWDQLPENITYPYITPVLWQEWNKRREEGTLPLFDGIGCGDHT